MKEDLYKWYPIVDEGEYWTDYELLIRDEHHNEVEKIRTIVTNGQKLWTVKSCRLGWGTMAKLGCWKYMRIKLDDSICRDELFNDEMCGLNI
jgi:hypothetical protein